MTHLIIGSLPFIGCVALLLWASTVQCRGGSR
jgi:hypothetical protein